ncbi:MAG TPA: DNA primase, partial [Solirubrobacter sp.]|nr:DNA primase [Solirubrobacter sp.]
MARYTDESRERVRDAVDFEELVGARTELKRAGVRRLQGLCPFHEERTPSFGIDPVEKLYHCFGCGAGGDVFRFVMDTEGLDFGAALESLAERYRVPLERETEDPRDAARRERRERLLALLERTAAYYVRVLWEAPEAADAREYLASRGLDEGALRAFRVGWAPNAWDRVLNASRRAGYMDAELLAAGLIQPARERRGPIDRFRGRITFPLADERGRVLGFGARAMGPDQKPKYLNTSDGELFHKGRIVYGADMARAAAAKAGRVVLVEGYTDVISLHQAGVPEVVAQMGTALTEAQVDAIARLAPRALFCLDPDSAGQASVARGIAALRTHNAGRATRAVEFRVVRLPAGSDPADVVQGSGAAAMRELLDEAVPIERFEVERALADRDATTDEMLTEAARAIAPMPPSVLRDELVRFVSSRLGLGEQLVNEALRAPARAAAAGPRAARWGDHAGRPGAAAGTRGAGPGDRFPDARGSRTMDELRHSAPEGQDGRLDGSADASAGGATSGAPGDSARDPGGGPAGDFAGGSGGDRGGVAGDRGGGAAGGFAGGSAGDRGGVARDPHGGSAGDSAGGSAGDRGGGSAGGFAGGSAGDRGGVA